MKERPILFSGEMVRAILAGRKTQTRRALKPQPTEYDGMWMWKKISWGAVTDPDDPTKHSPYGLPYDRLWVKETFQPLWATDEPGDYETGRGYNINYVATSGIKEWAEDGEGPLIQKCTPSIFMPRWASRITLEVMAVRVERLQVINEADAKAEGVQCGQFIASDRYWPTYKDAYETLWNKINGEGAWAKNPWVWVIEFKRV